MATPVMKPFTTEPVLTVSVSPHWNMGRTIPGLMRDIILAMMPAVIMAIIHFGFEAARVMALAGVVAVAAEAACLRIMSRDVCIDDYSALLTGLLFAFLLPASAPWWLVVTGSGLSIVLGKIIFGGVGANPLCAPLVGWAVCKISWKQAMDINLSMLNSEWTYPLYQLKHFGVEAVSRLSYTDLFLGKQLGGLGSVQVWGVLLGGLYLIVRKQIRPHIPLSFLMGVLVTASVYFRMDHTLYANPIFHLLTGSVMFGAFFLATDFASSPVGHLPMIAFGFSAGTLTVIIRTYGIYPDGVPFAILLANLLSPLLDRIGPKPFGKR